MRPSVSKTLFDVKLPATSKHYDLWVPDAMSMQEVGELVCQALQILEPDAFCYDGNQTLMYARTGQIQDPSATVAQIGFVDGDAFVVV